MRRAWLVVLVFVLDLRKVIGERKNGNFEETLENATICRNPQPPLSKKRIITITLDFDKRNGNNYLSGRTAVLEEVPFKNFSIITYSVDDSGRRELKYHLQKLNCRSLAGRAFLAIANFKFSNKCQMLEGTASFRDLDLNKIAHSLPNWHSVGSLIHRIQLVHRGDTIFCYEVLVTVKTVD